MPLHFFNVFFSFLLVLYSQNIIIIRVQFIYQVVSDYFPQKNTIFHSCGIFLPSTSIVYRDTWKYIPQKKIIFHSCGIFLPVPSLISRVTLDNFPQKYIFLIFCGIFFSITCSCLQVFSSFCPTEQDIFHFLWEGFPIGISFIHAPL